MKKILLLSVVLLAALVALGMAGFAYAQAPTPPAPESPYGQGGMGGRGHGGGMMGGWRQGGARGSGAYGPMHEYMLAAFAEALDMDVEELQALLDEGKTMWELAEEQGLSDEEFRDLMIEARTKAIEQMLADGVLTQEQADWMLDRMNQMWKFGGGLGPCPGGGWGRGSGGRWNSQPSRPSQPQGAQG
ncbi:MAG: hypothetical protein JXA78_15840 [Anaerolineales bacterium]|nr:hypothetical protein [Anaerolineales bacterium]